MTQLIPDQPHRDADHRAHIRLLAEEVSKARRDTIWMGFTCFCIGMAIMHFLHLNGCVAP